MYYGDVVSVLNSAKNDAERLKAQLLFSLANRYRTRLIRTIDTTFGKAQANLDVAARRRGASGNLRNSVTLFAINGGFAVTVGNKQVPYARIHEYGGVITPKIRQWLTIPSHKETYGYRARMFPLYFQLTRSGALLRFLGNYRTANENDIAFILVKRVKIREKAYIRNTLNRFRAEDAKEIIANYKRYFGDTSVIFEV
ncbi:MAG: hypothetical protein QW255_04575 [Candidatus Bilamarchaeaceae archaeon]